MFISRKLKRKLSLVSLLVFDFDGVMTDNKVLISESGEESAFVTRSDGMGLGILRNQGYKILFLSSETRKIVVMRAEKLHVPVIHGTRKKLEALKNYLSENGLKLENVLYVGNDVNDLECLQNVGVSVIPNDAHKSVKKFADIKLHTRGGDGVSREIAELLESIKK